MRRRARPASLAGLWLAAVLLLLVAVPEAAGAPPTATPTPAPQPSAAPGAPAVFEGQTLFNVPTGIGPFSPSARAAATVDNMLRIAKDRQVSVSTITIADSGSSTDVVGGDVIISSVTDADAAALGGDRRQIANQRAEAIRKAIGEYRRAHGWQSILEGVLFALLATLVLIASFIFLKRGSARAQRLLNSVRGTWIPAIKIQKFELLSADRLTNLLILAVKTFRVALVLFLFYIYIPLVLNFFPWTSGFASTLFGYITTPLESIWSAFVSYLPNLFYIAIIILVARIVLKFIARIFNEIEKGTIRISGFYPEWARPTYQIIRVMIVAVAAVAAFPYIPGHQSPAFQGISIFLGFLFSLSSASALGNIIAGLVLTYTRAFRVGDRVEIGDTTGDVIERTLLVTRLRTIKNVDVTIPNSTVLSKQIINYSSSPDTSRLILHTTVTIGYDEPWRTVHELLIDAALATENILGEPRPFVLQTALNDFYVSYEINAYTDKPAQMANTYSEMHRNIQDKFNEAGVEICSPHYGSLRDGNRIAIPDQYVPLDYHKPSFKVALEPPEPSVPPGTPEEKPSSGPE